MTFQQHTTYEQSVRLKELGLEQCTPESDHLGFRKVYWSKTVDGYDTVRFSPIGPTRLIGTFKDYVRALTRQEIEDILMKQYGLVTIGVAWETDTEPATVSVRLFIPNNADRFFTSESSDPFTSLYDALIWHLERQRKAPTTTPV